MKKQLYSFIFYKILGWKLIGNFPSEIKKCVVIVIPHTSNLDFFIALLVRGILGIKINFVGLWLHVSTKCKISKISS